MKNAPSDTTRKRRILIVDDHAIVRLGIRKLIDTEPDLSICGEAETTEQALDLVRTATPDLAIVDLSLGETHGLQLVRQLHETFPALLLLVLSMHDEALFAERVIRAGARGYIMKKGAIDGLVHAIRHVLAGRIYASESVAQDLLAGLTLGSAAAGNPIDALTDRELEVLELIGRGTSTSGIAKELGVSVKTIETYRANLKTKLKLKSGAELVRYAVTWLTQP